MRPLRFWTDSPINGNPYPNYSAPPPWWKQLIGAVFVAFTIWLLIVLASLIGSG